MTLTRTFLATAIALSLTACGGGSSSSTGGTAQVPDVQPPAPQTLTLSIQALKVDRCDNETPNADAILIVHNEDFTTKTIVAADENGNLVYTSDNQAENISVVYQGPEDSRGVSPVYVNSYIQHPMLTAKPMRMFTGEQSQCECQDSNFEVSNPLRADDHHDSFLRGVNSGYVNGDRQVQATICKPIDGSWPTIGTGLVYKGPHEAYAGLFEAFDPQATAVTVSSPGTVMTINTGVELAYRGILSYADSEVKLATDSYDGYAEPFIFDFDTIDYHRAYARHSEEQLVLPPVDWTYVDTYRDIHLTEPQAMVDLPLTHSLHTEPSDFVRGASNYDFSAFEGLDKIYWRLRALNGEGSRLVSWRLEGPVTGQIPNFENIDISAFMSPQTLAQSTRLYVDLYVEDYEGINGYTDFMTKLAQRTEDDMTSNTWSKSFYTGSASRITDLTLTNWPHSDGDGQKVKRTDEKAADSQPLPLRKFR